MTLLGPSISSTEASTRQDGRCIADCVLSESTCVAPKKVVFVVILKLKIRMCRGILSYRVVYFKLNYGNVM